MASIKEKQEQIIEKIIDYLSENEDEFTELIEEYDSYYGYLDDRRCYPMEDLNEFYRETEPIDILYRTYYGHDDDNYTTDENGNKHYGEFCPNREYFYYNGYGNLVSTDVKDYSDFLDSYFVQNIIDHYGNLTISNDLQEMIDEYENLEEEQEEETEDK